MDGFEQELDADSVTSASGYGRGYIDQMAKDLKMTVELVDFVWTKYGREANGSMDENGNMQISRNADKPEYTVVVHETTHRMKQLAPESYEVFRDMAVKIKPTAMEEIRRQYGEDAPTAESAMDEVAAEFAEEIFRDENKLRQFIEEAGKTVQTRNAVQKFFDMLREAIQKLKDTVLKLQGKGQTDAASRLSESLSDMERAEQLWKAAYIEAKEATGEQTGKNITLASNEWQTMYKLRGTEADGVKEQIRSHLSELNTMEPVADMTIPTEFGKTMGDARQWIEKQLERTGYQVERKDFGTIFFGEKLLNTSLNYVTNPAEIAAYVALPRVLKRGIEIGRHEDHKGRAYTTITFAAPIVLNGKRGNMAAVVKVTNRNGYKIHRILMPDGSAYELESIKKAEPTPAQGVTNTGSLATPINSANTIIVQPNEIVNGLAKGISGGNRTTQEKVLALQEAYETHHREADREEQEKLWLETFGKELDGVLP